ncbi:MAG: hypothetical protein FAF05_00405 [Epsilonproteobacteria bacterium]|nr:hypothetical protein [Campylobacterota bacterium]
MLYLSIQEPKVEQFFNHSKDEILKALQFIVENNIYEYKIDKNDLKLSVEQKKELNSRIISFHNNRDIGRSWDEIKNNILINNEN